MSRYGASARVGGNAGEPAIRFDQASSSEMFGEVRQTPQNYRES